MAKNAANMIQKTLQIFSLWIATSWYWWCWLMAKFLERIQSRQAGARELIFWELLATPIILQPPWYIINSIKSGLNSKLHWFHMSCSQTANIHPWIKITSYSWLNSANIAMLSPWKNKPSSKFYHLMGIYVSSTPKSLPPMPNPPSVPLSNHRN